MNLTDFNDLPPHEAAGVLRPCADIPRWIDSIVSRRPYASEADLFAEAASAAPDWTEAEIKQALSHHPRIGEQAGGSSAEAAHSRSEQSGLDSSDQTAALLAAGNQAYEQKFGRVFLIRAKGRSAEEILASLNERLEHSEEQELPVIASELRSIALLRLEGIFTP